MTYLLWNLRRPLSTARSLSLILCLALTSEYANAAIVWDGEAGSNWWFNPVNWNASSNANNLLPPNPTVSSGDAQINMGLSGSWNVTGEGVVYDPANDPSYAAASSLSFPTDTSPIQTYVGSNYGPQHIYRLYIGRNTALSNTLTIKSGDLAIASTFIVGRSGNTSPGGGVGSIVQTGGRLRAPLSAMDLGQSESSGFGNGTYDYRGGTVEIDLEGTTGIRLSHGSASNGPGGIGKFVIHNPATGGHARAWRYTSGSWRGSVNATLDTIDPNGQFTGVGISEFHYENGGTRPMQIGQNLTINNGLQTDTLGTVSSRLDLVLHQAACSGAACIPNNIGLFDVDFDLGFGSNGGIVAGSGEKGGYFSSVDGSTDYTQGSTVSALFGGVRYDWSISYQGSITWSDADNSVVGSVSGTGGNDVVLIGLGSQSVGLPGDFNGDGDVDGRDFLTWQRNTSVGSLVDWKSNYGTGGSLASFSAVPEPTALILLWGAALPLLARRI